MDVQKDRSRRDFFISYNKADRFWAEWVAWELEEEGYTTILQDWDFRPGQNFIIRMSQAAQEAERTIAILSPDYLNADYTQPEWAAAFAQDPMGSRGLLLPIRVRECDLQGLLPQIIYIDLVGSDEASSREKLLAGVIRGRAKPTDKPIYPGTLQRSVAECPPFPGRTAKPPRRILVPMFILVSSILFVVLLFVYLSSVGAPPIPSSNGAHVDSTSSKMKIVLIFCDVTASLSRQQITKVATLAADILDSLEKGNRYAVYPIGQNSGQAPPIIPTGIIPTLRSFIERDVYDSHRAMRRSELEKQINALYGTVDHGRRQTCILSLLPFVYERLTRMADLSTLDPTICDFEVYFISDMVENCDSTPIGPVKMSDSDNLLLIRLIAKRFPQGAADLSSVRLTVIIPSTSDSDSTKHNGPAMEFLKGFWKEVFLRCGFKEDWFWDHRHIDWISSGEIPDRLKSQTPKN